MVAPVVVVEVAPADTPPTLQQALLESCSSALRRGTCVAADAPGAEPAPQATAVVVWSGPAQEKVRVQVGVRRKNEPVWLERQLEFAPLDAPEDRWRAAGLTVATLVGELTEPATLAGTVQPPTTAQPAVPERRTRRPRNDAKPPESKPREPNLTRTLAPAGWLALGGAMAPGSDSEGTRLGGVVETAVGVDSLYGLARFDMTWGVAEPSALSLRWMTLGLGGALRVPLPSWGMDAAMSGRLVLQQLTASVDGAGGQDWTPGIAGGFTVHWPRETRLALVVGVDAWRLWNATVIRWQATERVRSPAYGIRGWVGLAVRFGEGVGPAQLVGERPP